ncbi:MAG TPA: CAP domain-containing protein [Candidatus Baltobacteraceae bacterium]|nr:CAP domain-containing protein [Candidatus Baltobacteraceae bacterium]
MTTPSRHAIPFVSKLPATRSAIAAAILLGAAAIGTALCAQEILPVANYRPRTDQLELQMLDLVNRDRSDPSAAQETKGHARPLDWDGRLAEVARLHSEEMAREGFFSHEGMDGSDPSNRVTRAGVQWRSTGENIAKCRDVAEAEQNFMDEPRFRQNHRGNILNPEYTHIGIGIARGPDGTLYITQEFAQER